MSDAPERIWVQSYTKNGNSTFYGSKGTAYVYMGNYRESEHDVEYVRADVAQERIKKLEEVLEQRPPIANCNTPGYVAWYKQAQAILDGYADEDTDG